MCKKLLKRLRAGSRGSSLYVAFFANSDLQSEFLEMIKESLVKGERGPPNFKCHPRALDKNNVNLCFFYKIPIIFAHFILRYSNVK